MKNFLTKLKRSLSDRGLYRDIASGDEPFRLRYAFFLALIPAIVAVATVTVGLYREGLPAAKTFVSESVPADLVASVSSGKFSVNLPMPYVVPLSAAEAARTHKTNALVIDTGAEATLDVTTRYQTTAFVNADAFVIEKENGQIEATPFKEVPDVTFTRDIALGWLEVATKYAWLVAIVAIIPVVAVEFIGLVVTAALAAIAVWIVMKIASRPTTYGRSFGLAVHACTFVVAADLALALLGAPGVPGLFSIAIVAILAPALALSGRKGA